MTTYTLNYDYLSRCLEKGVLTIHYKRNKGEVYSKNGTLYRKIKDKDVELNKHTIKNLIILNNKNYLHTYNNKTKELISVSKFEDIYDLYRIQNEIKFSNPSIDCEFIELATDSNFPYYKQ